MKRASTGTLQPGPQNLKLNLPSKFKPEVSYAQSELTVEVRHKGNFIATWTAAKGFEAFRLGGPSFGFVNFGAWNFGGVWGVRGRRETPNPTSHGGTLDSLAYLLLHNTFGV